MGKGNLFKLHTTLFKICNSFTRAPHWWLLVVVVVVLGSKQAPTAYRHGSSSFSMNALQKLVLLRPWVESGIKLMDIYIKLKTVVIMVIMKIRNTIHTAGIVIFCPGSITINYFLKIYPDCCGKFWPLDAFWVRHEARWLHQADLWGVELGEDCVRDGASCRHQWSRWESRMSGNDIYKIDSFPPAVRGSGN